MRGKKIREPSPLHSKFLNPLFICAVILPHGNNPGILRRIQERHSCQLAPEKEGQRLMREQGESKFGLKRHPQAGEVDGESTEWGVSPSVRWLLREVMSSSLQSPRRESLSTDFHTVWVNWKESFVLCETEHSSACWGEVRSVSDGEVHLGKKHLCWKWTRSRVKRWGEADGVLCIVTSHYLKHHGWIANA